MTQTQQNVGLTQYPKGFHPNSRAVLMASRRSWSEQRKCERCGSPAMRGRAQCIKHDGRAGARNVSPARADARRLDLLRLYGLLPADLIRTDLWRALDGLGMATRAPMQRALIMLWDKREREPGPFGQVWRHCQMVVRTHGRAR